MRAAVIKVEKAAKKKFPQTKAAATQMKRSKLTQPRGANVNEKQFESEKTCARSNLRNLAGLKCLEVKNLFQRKARVKDCSSLKILWRRRKRK